VISLGLLLFVILKIGLGDILGVLRTASLGPLVVAFVLFILGVIVRAARWRALLVALDIDVPFRRLIYLYFSGSFFNVFLPTGFGGDVVRVLELAQETQATAALGTVIVDRMTGLLVLLVMALGALPFGGAFLPLEVRWIVIVLAVGGLAAGGLVLEGRVLRRLGGWLPGPLSLTGEGALARAYAAVTACGWRAVGQALGYSLLFNSLLIGINYLAAVAVGMELDLIYFLFLVPVLSTTLMLPISIGGLGVRDTAAVLLFTQVGADQAVAAASSLAVYGISALTGLFGGVLYLVQSTRSLGKGWEETG
jgi:uncharacterized membrane protein YbhN (UPF0104 family)